MAVQVVLCDQVVKVAKVEEDLVTSLIAEEVMILLYTILRA